MVSTYTVTTMRKKINGIFSRLEIYAEQSEVTRRTFEN